MRDGFESGRMADRGGRGPADGSDGTMRNWTREGAGGSEMGGWFFEVERTGVGGSEQGSPNPWYRVYTSHLQVSECR
jgi:hypothetical protein